MVTVNSVRFEARVSPDVHALLKRAAELEGRGLSDFVISTAKLATQKTITETETIQLSLADQMAFADALINPPTHNDALKRAFKRHQ